MKTMKTLELINALQEILSPNSPNSSRLDNADSIERKVMARFSCDNLLLQKEQCWTREEIDEGLKRARENALKYGD